MDTIDTSSARAALASRPKPQFDTTIEKDFFKLPAGRTTGGIFGVAFDSNNHIWLAQQQTTYNDPLRPGETSESRLPPICEFDENGKYLRGWGGDDQLPRVNGHSQWPQGTENICIDNDGCFWIFGYTPEDQSASRFTPDGKFLMRIGERGKTGGESSTEFLSTPTAMTQIGREIFFADGYGAHRVAAFDIDTGKYTRHFGSYGRDPATMEPGEGYKLPVHHIATGPDGMLYVCDRRGNRVQVFDVSGGKTRYVREVVVGPSTSHFGAAFAVAFSPDGKFMYVGDGTNQRIWIVAMSDFEVLSWFSADAQEGVGNQVTGTRPVHRIGTDRQGNLIIPRGHDGIERRRFLGVS